MDPERHEELEIQLSAYLDGELDDAQRQEVEALLAEDPEAAELYEQLKVTRELVKSLPRAKADEEWTEALRGRMERQALLGDMLNASAHSRKKVTLAPWLALAAVLALSFTAVIYMWPGQEASPTGDQYAMEDQEQVEKGLSTEEAALRTQGDQDQGPAALMTGKPQRGAGVKTFEAEDIPAVLADQLAATEASNLAIVELAYARPEEMEQSVQHLQKSYGLRVIGEEPEAKSKLGRERARFSSAQEAAKQPTTKPADQPRRMTLAMNVSDRVALKQIVADLQGQHPADNQWLLMVPADVVESQPASAPAAEQERLAEAKQATEEETGGPSFTRLLKANRTMVTDIHDFIDKLQNNPLYVKRQLARAKQEEATPAATDEGKAPVGYRPPSKKTQSLAEAESADKRDEKRDAQFAAGAPATPSAEEKGMGETFAYQPEPNRSVDLATKPATTAPAMDISTRPSEAPATQPTNRLRIFLWVEQEKSADTVPASQPVE